ncbi:Putative NmrA-like domain, NAD(P)-binding domain superfamily [Septoria linicola]|uniref:NmrA-like domain, NAD(P)-binding domain superfamily n=1 Tax=Septoria linicola TaxID=215465 RepID=A0A9Q9AU20_9PEZI|nr:putative NmrA-like domain, NAD(P)-binding domain superfamily [Septoria linicola]USW53198.1 Putative NmrA-like domain, NAD(P)-binding domain superfamily [Septoria linicola]
MAPDSVLVLGLGELGTEVVKSLATHPDRKNTRLDVLLRSQKSQQLEQLQQWKVEPVAGNVTEDTQEQLSKIFKSYHTVICCTGMYSPPSTQLKIARAALDAGVKRYFPWQFGIDYDVIGRGSGQDMFDSQLDVRDLLRGQSSTKWVIVSTGMFIPFLFEPAFGLVNEERNVVTGIGSWSNEITVTNPEDIGKVTAELALGYPDVEGVVYASGDTISMASLAEVVEQTTGRHVDRKLKTVPDLEQELMEKSSDMMCKYRVVFGKAVGVSWPKAKSFNETHGITTQTVADWAAQHIKG